MTSATFLSILIGGALIGTSIHAETIDDLEDRKSKIADERQEIKSNLSEAESEMADLLIELEELNQEIEQLREASEKNQEQLDETEAKIDITQEDIDELQEEIDIIEKRIELRLDILKERLSSYQKQGGSINYMEVVLGSKNFGEFISRTAAVNKIMESDRHLMESHQEDKQEVEEKQSKVQSKLSELEEMKVELEGMITLIADQKEQAESKKEEMKDKQTDLIALQEELKMKDSDLASLESNIRGEIAAKEREQRAQARAVASETNNSSNGNIVTVSSKTSEDKSSSIGNSQSGKKTSGSYSSAIQAGYQVMGTPYVWGGKTPSGFDCSGFLSWAFAQAGKSIPSSTAALQSVGTKVSYSNAQPGDLVFFNTYKTNGHIGIYLGGGKFLGAQNSTGVAVADMTSGYWAEKFAGHVRRVN
ncbi:peptidase [Halalkalibacillus sediminis]|uniref:Peptidase n=2 Tax=Halalkalibacillus sediminis TaxID=2018042 RepID=A0A2I0QYJ8_9BACI|nr:peptidase [Halalkalibacillus sediminis]